MTRALRYRIVNVFTVDGARLSGNPLCVFEDGTGLSDVEMQALARQMNLSETTFLLDTTTAGVSKRVRIFTPTFEMPFAGHPTLGSAHVTRDLARGSGAGEDHVRLEMHVGVVDVRAHGDTWTLTAAQAPVTRAAAARADIARMLALDVDAIAHEPLWVDTGAEQLVIPLASVADVEKARPSAELLARFGFSEKRGAAMAYVWAPNRPRDPHGPHDSHDSHRSRDPMHVTARFFFLVHGGVVEDPATGSACANLGGWHVATGRAPVALTVSQGAHVGRPSRLGLRVERTGDTHAIHVSGDVIELGAGEVRL